MDASHAVTSYNEALLRILKNKVSQSPNDKEHAHENKATLAVARHFIYCDMTVLFSVGFLCSAVNSGN
jgi:hypothetical protein